MKSSVLEPGSVQTTLGLICRNFGPLKKQPELQVLVLSRAIGFFKSIHVMC